MTNLYRPTITSQQYASFERSLVRALKESDLSAIGYVGVIGSMTKIKRHEAMGKTGPITYGHDIDVVIFPEPSATIGAAMQGTDELFDTADAILVKETGLTLSPSGRKIRQESNYVGVRNATGRQPLMVHRLIYPDKESILVEAPDGAFYDFARREAMPLHGVWGVIEEQPTRNAQAVDAHYWLERYDISSHATANGVKRDLGLLLMETESAVDYVNKQYGTTIDKQRLTHATPQAIRAFVRDARRTIDERLAA